MKRRWIICLVFALTGCGVPDATSTAPPALSPTASEAAIAPAAIATPSTVAPTPTSIATAPTALPTIAPVATPALPADLRAQADDLAATVAAALAIQPTPDPSTPDRPLEIEGIRAFPLQEEGAQEQRWVVYPIGYANPAPHFVAIYARRQDQWQELDRIALSDDVFIILDGWVRQIELPSDDLWIAVDSGVGAHSAAYDLVRWDGQKLRAELHDITGVAEWGREIDLDGDGVLDLLRDHRDTYVFCHACGMARMDYRVWTWDGERMAPVSLQTLAVDAPSELRRLNDRAVRMAEGGLWHDAEALIAQAHTITPDDRTVRWNKLLIDLTAQGYREQLASNSYPLLATMFYGDYDAALDLMRVHSAEQLFDRAHPPEFGSYERPTTWITETATLALDADPDRAAAYFIRGWAHYFAADTRPLTLPDLERAAALNPAEPLFRDSLVLVRRQIEGR